MTLRYRLRPAVQTDITELARLLSLLGHGTTAASIVQLWPSWEAEGNRGLVAELDSGSLAGAAILHRMTTLHRPKPVGRINALVVDDGLRGQGIGRALVAAAEELLQKEGCGLMEITSNVKWTEAHAFYAHLGYERTSVRFARTLMPED